MTTTAQKPAKTSTTTASRDGQMVEALGCTCRAFHKPHPHHAPAKVRRGGVNRAFVR